MQVSGSSRRRPAPPLKSHASRQLSLPSPQGRAAAAARRGATAGGAGAAGAVEEWKGHGSRRWIWIRNWIQAGAEPVDAGGRRHARAVQVGGGPTGSFHAVVSSGKHLATIITTTTTNQSLVVPASLLLFAAGPPACVAILVTCWLYFQTCCQWFQVQTSSHVFPWWCGASKETALIPPIHTCSASP